MANSPSTKPKVLIIIPAFNEARSIKSLLKEIKSLHPTYPIVVINDGSTDETLAEAGDVTVVTHPYNLGIGGAVQTGFKIAQAEDVDIAVQIDGDGQHDPAYLEELMKPVIDGTLDLAIGSRFLSADSAFRSTFR